MIALSCILCAAYALLLGWYAFGWQSLPYFKPRNDSRPALRFTVLVPFHNEAHHIVACLEALAQQDHPAHLHEILLLDDGSTDASPQLVAAWLQAHPHTQIRLVRLEKMGKKAALAHGVSIAQGTHIACTDADCTPPATWLSLLAAAFEQRQGTCLVAGPVVFHQERGLLGWFQSLDLMGLMCVTGSGIHFGWQRMANGANMAYTKAAFEAVGGYAGNDHIASGDDLFLVQKIAQRWPDSIFFLKNRAAIVPTLTMPTLARFVRQRLRWGGKNAALPEWPVRLSLLLVFMVCWAILTMGVATLFAAHFAPPFAVLFLGKMFVDFLFLGNMALFFKKTRAMWWFVPSQIAHVVYVALIGLGSLLGRDVSRW